jgi:hypothetical protein
MSLTPNRVKRQRDLRGVNLSISAPHPLVTMPERFARTALLMLALNELLNGG